MLALDIRVSRLKPDAEPPVIEVFFKSARQGFDQSRTVRQDLRTDGQWQTVRLPLFRCDRWFQAGEISQLRVDVMDCEGVVEIRDMRLDNDLDLLRRHAGERGRLKRNRAAPE